MSINIQHCLAVGDLQTLKDFIKRENCPDYTDKFGNPIISSAVKSGNYDVVEMLVELKANVNCTDRFGNSVLSSAVSKGVQMCEILIKAGANPNSTDRFGSSVLCVALKSSNLKVIELLLKNGADPKSKDRFGKSALILSERNPSIHNLLVKYSAKLPPSNALPIFPKKIVDFLNNFVPQQQAFIQPLDILQEIIPGPGNNLVKQELGNVELQSITSQVAPGTPSQKSHTITNDRNFDHADGNLHATTKLFQAASLGNIPELERLCALGVDLNSRIILEDFTLYKDSNNIEVSSTKYIGATALYIAAWKGQFDFCKQLIDKRVNIEYGPYELVNHSPLAIAIISNHVDICKLLIDFGAVIQHPTGPTLLHYAAKSGNLQICKMLVEAGAILDATEPSQGHTPLYLSAFLGHALVCQLLLESGAKVNLQSRDGSTALYASVSQGHLHCCKVLVLFEANVMVERSDGMTPYVLSQIMAKKSKTQAEIYDFLTRFKVSNVSTTRVDERERYLNPFNVAVTARESKVFSGYFNNMEKVGSIAKVDSVVPFLYSSGLSKKQLAHIWELSGGVSRGTGLELNEFYVACKLVALIQNGIAPTLGNVRMASPLPVFDLVKETQISPPIAPKESDLLGIEAQFKVKDSDMVSVNLTQQKSSVQNFSKATEKDSPKIPDIVAVPAPVIVVEEKLTPNALDHPVSAVNTEFLGDVNSKPAETDIAEPVANSPEYKPVNNAQNTCVRTENENLTKLGKDSNLELDAGESTPLSELFKAAVQGDISEIERLYALGVDLNSRMLPEDYNLAKDAAHPELSSIYYVGATALYIAAGKGHVEFCKRLIDKKVNIEYGPYGLVNHSPLTIAIICNNAEVCRILIDSGAVIHHQTGLTHLHYASKAGSLECCKLLLDAGAAVDVKGPSQGQTPLFMAAFYGKSSICKLLLESGAQVDYCSVDGSTALFAAVTNGHFNCCKVLIACGADMLLTPSGRISPFMQSQLLSKTSKYHADISEFFINLRKRNNEPCQTPTVVDNSAPQKEHGIQPLNYQHPIEIFLSNEEVQFFTELFSNLEKDGKFAKASAVVEFLYTSGLSKKHLSQVWELSGGMNRESGLDWREFLFACKRVALIQNGFSPILQNIAKRCPLPVFNTPSVKFSPQNSAKLLSINDNSDLVVPPVALTKIPKQSAIHAPLNSNSNNFKVVSVRNDPDGFSKHFDDLNPVNGFLPGDNVKRFFLNSGLSPETLRKVWDLVDGDKSGRLSRSDFITACKIIRALKMKP